MNDNAVHDPQAIKRNRFFGIIIIAIIAAPMLLAYIMFHTGWGVSANTTNKGELVIPALPVQDLNLTETPDALSNLYLATGGEHTKKWRILVPVTAQCDQVCKNNLYISRQVHIRLAEKAYRVERVVVALDTLPQSLENELQTEHPNIRRAVSTREQFSQWLAPANIGIEAENYYYLVDQEGFAMMRYSDQHTGQDLLDDIKKLLKFTYDK